MKKMRAIRIDNQYSDIFKYSMINIPKINDNEILVEVMAIGVGIQDTYYFPPFSNYPYTIGIEGSGIIKQVGKKVKRFKVNDRIAYISINEIKGGTYADYVVLGKNSLVIKIPNDMGFVEAAAIPVSGNTMIKTIKALQLKKNDRVFIAGASGSNGTLLIQMIKEIGCKISASASKANHEYLRSLKVDKTVDYNDSNWSQQILDWTPGGVDVAIAIQPNTSSDCINVVRDNGKIISISGDSFKCERGIKEIAFPYTIDVLDDLNILYDKVTKKDIVIVIESIYDFNEALIAIDKVKSRKARGKSVILVK